MLIERRQQIAYASHQQFHIEDAIHPGDTGDISFWSQEAYENRLALADGTIGIGTGSYGDVAIIAEIHDAEPPISIDEWDHITEASLMVRSGQLQVIGCLAQSGEGFMVAPGSYRVRCCHADLELAIHDGQGAEWYLVQVWPAEMEEARVVKKWEEIGD